MQSNFDLIVIGSGSGLDVASALAAQEFKVAIIEKGRLGGTCLNRGCIPSKMLIHSADLIETIKHAHLFGIKVDKYSIDFRSIIERVSRSVDEDSFSIERGLERSQNPKLFKGECHFTGHKTIQVGKDVLTAEKILISSGGRPRIPKIEGLEGSGFITSEEALRLETQPKDLTIIGGGYIAVELAHFFGSLGTKINIVQHHKTLIPNEDEEISESFTKIFGEKYNILTESEPIGVSKDGKQFRVIVRNGKNNQKQTLASDQLLVATGTTPNSDLLKVEKTGIKTDARGYVITDEFLETNVKGIFALGDAVGHYLFKHSANLEAQYDFNNIFSSEDKVPVDYSAMPHAIFSSPQIAGVGKTEQQLRQENVDYTVGRYNYIDTGMGQAIEDRTGFVKLLVEKTTRRILGCHIMGTDASTLIHEVLVSMKSGDGTTSSITRTVHIHPALSEVIQRAASSVE